MVAYCYFENKNTEAKEANTEGIFKRTVAGKERDCYLCDWKFGEKGCLVARVFTDITNEFGSTKFRKGMQLESRDIFIVDVERAFLLKNATFLAHYNLNDNSFAKDFFDVSASEYFTASKDQEQDLFEFFEKKSELKVKSIRIFSLNLLNPDLALLFKLIDKNGNGNKEISIDENEIVSKISSFGDYKPQQVGDLGDLRLVKPDFGIEIHFKEAVEYFRINYYLMEIMLYFQLFSPDFINIDVVQAKVGKEYYQFFTAENWNLEDIIRNRYQLARLKGVQATVSVRDEDILTFLKNCYEKISCQRDVAHVCDLRFLVFLYHHVLEDVFMNYFRLIELFFKEKIRLLVDKLKDNNSLTDKEEKYIKNFDGRLKDKKELTYKDVKDILKLEESEDINNALKEIKKILNENLESCEYCKYIEKLKIDIGDTANEKIMRWAIKKSFDAIKKYGEDLKNSEDIQKCAFKIVCLRNHYTHCGYYIPDEGIKYGTGGNCKKVGIPDVYKLLRTVLFPIAMDIIFKDILGYEHYEFPSPFPEDLF